MPVKISLALRIYNIRQWRSSIRPFHGGCDGLISRMWWQWRPWRPKILLLRITIHYNALLHISQSLSVLYLPESWITKCCLKLIYVILRDTTGEGGCVRSAHHIHLAGDTGTVPFGYSNGCRNCAHRYNHYLASADSSSRAGDSCPMYFVNSWALGWSRDPWSWMKCSVFVWPIITHYLNGAS